MNVSLKPEFEKFVDEQVKAGHFGSLDEVLEEALVRLMGDMEGELDEETLAAIQESEEQIERGEYRDWKEVSAELRAKYLGE